MGWAWQNSWAQVRNRIQWTQGWEASRGNLQFVVTKVKSDMLNYFLWAFGKYTSTQYSQEHSREDYLLCCFHYLTKEEAARRWCGSDPLTGVPTSGVFQQLELNSVHQLLSTINMITPHRLAYMWPWHKILWSASYTLIHKDRAHLLSKLIFFYRPPHLREWEFSCYNL